MAVTPLRVTGPVLTTSTREVTRKSDGERFVFRTASVLVGNKGVIDVGFRDDNRSDLPGEGELVDFLVDGNVFNGELRCDFIQHYAEPSTGLRTASKTA